jgi:hypothetical protein
MGFAACYIFIAISYIQENHQRTLKDMKEYEYIPRIKCFAYQPTNRARAICVCAFNWDTRRYNTRPCADLWAEGRRESLEFDGTTR